MRNRRQFLGALVAAGAWPARAAATGATGRGRGGDWGEVATGARGLEPPAADDLRDAVTRAVKQRPEIRALGLRQQTNDIQKKFNADQTKPQVNLIASYGNTGLGGTLSTNVNPFSAAQTDSFLRLNDLSARAAGS